MILEFYPDARVVTNAKCRDLLVALLHIPQERFLIITDGETLSLGNRTLPVLYHAVDSLARNPDHVPCRG